jgi:hypothetical protein
MFFVNVPLQATVRHSSLALIYCSLKMALPIRSAENQHMFLPTFVRRGGLRFGILRWRLLIVH